MNTITMHKVTKSFVHNQHKIVIINQVTMTFFQQKSYAITGVSGSGKSTLLHMLAHLLAPDSGTISFNNKPYAWHTHAERAAFLRTNIGIVFQQPYIIPELSVIENIIVPGLLNNESKKICIAKGEQLLKEVELETLANEPIKSLSGGQQHRVALARALFNKPTFLLADEPTSSLDATTATHIAQLIIRLHRAYNIGLILCTHDKKIVELLDHRIVIDKGTITLP
jgi:ABC-type lipoprotein export system ATPase subunit